MGHRRLPWSSCSQVESVSELSFGQVGFVVDLHLLVLVDISHAAGLEVLESELSLHAGAAVWGIADEASLAQGARVVSGGLEIVDDIDWIITKGFFKLIEG